MDIADIYISTFYLYNVLVPEKQMEDPADITRKLFHYFGYLIPHIIIPQLGINS